MLEFNLDQAIANWRRQMIAGGLESMDALHELESHLRDDIEAQVRSGLDEKQAFELAIRRLGAPREVSGEFAKSARLEPERRRTLLWCFYFFCATVATLADLWTLISFELRPGERVGAACAVTVFGLYLYCLPLLPWWRGLAWLTYLMGMMKAMGIIVPLWIVFALSSALRMVHWEISIIPQMSMWSLCAAYGLTALAWALKESDGRQGGSGGGFIPLSLVPPGGDIPVRPLRRFTPTARRALELAREEALTLGHDYVGTEHVLLGVLTTAGSALAQLLQRNHVNSEAVRAEVGRLVSALPARPAATALPLTPRARKALHFARQEADALENVPIGPEHILLGLLHEGSGVAALALSNLGVRQERLRSEILRD